MAKSATECVLENMVGNDPLTVHARQRALEISRRVAPTDPNFKSLLAREIRASWDDASAADDLYNSVVQHKHGKIDADATQARLRSFMTYTHKDADVSVEFLYKEMFGRALIKGAPKLYEKFKKGASSRDYADAHFNDEAFRKEIEDSVEFMTGDLQEMGIGGVEGLVDGMKRRLAKPQSTNSEKILEAGADEFIRKTREWVKQTDAELLRFHTLATTRRSMWDERLQNTILTAEDYEVARTLDFNDQDAWLAYHKKWGQTTNMGDVILRTMNNNAREAAIAQKFQSVNPRKVWNDVIARLNSEGVKTSGIAGEHLDEIGMNVFGDTSHWVAQASEKRKFITNALGVANRFSALNVLGQTFFATAGGDLAATVGQEMATYGARGKPGVKGFAESAVGGGARAGKYVINQLTSLIFRGIPNVLGGGVRMLAAPSKTLSGIAQKRPLPDRVFGIEKNLGQELLEHLEVLHLVQQQRLFNNVRFTSDAVDASSRINDFSNAFYEHNGTSFATGASYYSGLTDIMTKVAGARGTQFALLPDFLQERLTSFRISPKEWDSLKDADFTVVGGVKFIDPTKLNRELGLKMKNFYLRNIGFMAGEDSAAIDAIMNKGLAKGATARETMALMWNVKTFMVRSYVGVLEPLAQNLGKFGFRRQVAGGVGATGAGLIAYLPIELLRQRFNEMGDFDMSRDVGMQETLDFAIERAWSDNDKAKKTWARATTYGLPFGYGNDILGQGIEQILSRGSPRGTFRELASEMAGAPALLNALETAWLPFVGSWNAGEATLGVQTSDEAFGDFVAAAGNVVDNYTPDIMAAQLIAQYYMKEDLRATLRQLKGSGTRLVQDPSLKGVGENVLRTFAR